MRDLPEPAATISRVAARTRADEMAVRALKDAARTAWGLDDYHRFAKATTWPVGQVLVEAAGVAAGQRVLDVAAGSGNVAIKAAERGASVVASDLTPENFDAGRREAQARGVELDWVEADAEALPFADSEFDVVTSAFGAMFAPAHERVAGELLRVCRPGGTIALASFTPEGLGGEFFELFARYAPPPPRYARPPLLWGTDEHVRELFGDALESLDLTRLEYLESAESPAAYAELFLETFGPIVALRAGLGERADEFDRELLDFATHANRAKNGGAEYPYEYLLVVARKRRS
jgi:2-polyprenyl-6-hydroxyphenyl methylase/3-demethylubiquinone-9 3-methyltransferase